MICGGRDGLPMMRASSGWFVEEFIQEVSHIVNGLGVRNFLCRRAVMARISPRIHLDLQLLDGGGHG